MMLNIGQTPNFLEKGTCVTLIVHNYLLFFTVPISKQLFPLTFYRLIKLACGLPILQMVETIRHQIMEMRGKRRIEAANWETTLCPNIEKVLANI
ncbi:hypothetical protein Taro_034522 [Colocasia esculenta]|uniref:Uncharacterized protein n=1 Tax=Colocasia esculenta TaxID=4460 RepID=A0A843WAB2_COLES|nr:hypothetical protein [Colocasia esculenta]